MTVFTSPAGQMVELDHEQRREELGGEPGEARGIAEISEK